MAMRETWVQSLGWEDPWEKGKATHSSILAHRIPWTVRSWGRRIGYYLATCTLTHTAIHQHESATGIHMFPPS